MLCKISTAVIIYGTRPSGSYLQQITAIMVIHNIIPHLELYCLNIALSPPTAECELTCDIIFHRSQT